MTGSIHLHLLKHSISSQKQVLSSFERLAISKFRLLSEALNQGQHVSQAALSLFARMMV
jgi:hypothetical protein